MLMCPVDAIKVADAEHGVAQVSGKLFDMAEDFHFVVIGQCLWRSPLSLLSSVPLPSFPQLPATNYQLPATKSQIPASARRAPGARVRAGKRWFAGAAGHGKCG